jgi:hypothetical protein
MSEIPPDTPVPSGGGIKTFASKAELEDKIKKLTLKYDEIIEKKKALSDEKKEKFDNKKKEYDKRLSDIKAMVMKMMEKGVNGKPLKSLEIEGRKINVSINKKIKPVKKCEWEQRIHEVLSGEGIERADDLSEIISEALCKGEEIESTVCSITKKKE